MIDPITGPYIFTKLLRPHVKHSREQGIFGRRGCTMSTTDKDAFSPHVWVITHLLKLVNHEHIHTDELLYNYNLISTELGADPENSISGCWQRFYFSHQERVSQRAVQTSLEV